MLLKGLSIEEAKKAINEKMMEVFEKNRDQILPKYEIGVTLTLLKIKEDGQNPPEVKGSGLFGAIRIMIMDKTHRKCRLSMLSPN